MFIAVITRVKNENYMLKSFIPHYLDEGVDKIYLLNDSSTEPFEDWVLNHPKVEIRPLKMRHPEWSEVRICAHSLRNIADWVITVDCDEFITTRRNKDKTIREELETTFKDASCIKVPWAMFTRNGRKEMPNDVVLDTTWRWSQDIKHSLPNNVHSKKFHDRYDYMEVKCIWKPKHYTGMHVHHPYKPTDPSYVSVESVDNLPSSIELHSGSIYRGLREEHINRAYLICNHYRIVSEEHAKMKCNPDSCTLYIDSHEQNVFQNALNADFPDIEDTLLSEKYEKRRNNK